MQVRRSFSALKGTIYLLIGSMISLVIILGLCFQMYVKSISEDLLLGWLQTEAVSIQEGNLLASLSRNRRMVLSSQLVSSVALVSETSNSEHRDVLAEFGPSVELSKLRLPSRVGEISTTSASMFRVIASYRFPEDPTLSIYFDVYPKFLVWIFAALNVSLWAMFLIVMMGLRAIHSKQVSLRQRFISAAVAEFVNKGENTEIIEHEFPDLASSIVEMRETIRQLKEEIKRESRNSAIARTTQMLAHDVRKPFSMLKMAMDSIRSASSLAAAHRVTETMLPEVEQAMLSVNGLIEDVMEVGGTGNLTLEETDPVTLVQRCIEEAVRVHPRAEFTLERTWTHSRSVRCDERKVARVFSNIASNAVQATPSGGLLWIRTRDLQINGSDFIEFEIGNNGSFIDHESLPLLFEAFYTKNKKGGTGLGLAIAHKIVTSHGGMIACRSERNDAFPIGMVEFTFTLPAGDPSEKEVLNSTTTAHILRAAFAAESMATLSGASAVSPFAEDEIRLEGEVEHSLSSSCRLLEVLIVDDEKLYRDGLKNQLISAASFASSINLTLHDNADAVHGFLSRQTTLDLAILDVDIGSSQVNGFDLAKSIRERFPQCIICIHSNRNLSGDHRTALEHGANAFQPKPMVRPHLLKLLLQASTAVTGKEPADSALDGLPGTSSTQSPSFGRNEESAAKRIAVVDDSEATLISWRLKIGSKDADFFSCPEKFMRHANEHNGYFRSLACIVSDFNFGNESEETGTTFARSVREVSDVPFFLSTNQNFTDGVPDPSISSLIPKATMARTALLELAQKVKPSLQNQYTDGT